MRIVILGAGQVGGTLAEMLTSEDNDITLVDLDEDRLRELQHKLDIQIVRGSAAHPSVLVNSGIEQADMLIAVTNSDEINMMGCQIAYSLFRTPTKIARIRSHHYDGFDRIFCNDHVPVDVRINPEQLVTEHIQNLIDYPGASRVMDFGKGRILLFTIKPKPGGLMVGQTVTQLREHLGVADARLVAIFRDNKSLDTLDSVRIAAGDETLFVASATAIQQVLIVLGSYAHPNRRVMIAGGGHIGRKLALALEKKYRIKVIDHNPENTSHLASQLHKGTVLQGDIADKNLLVNENIEFMDVFCAVTNDDEANIMSCLQAKRIGARHTMALVNRKTYVELIEDSSIDQAISPQLITIGSILAKLRQGNMVKVQRLQHDDAEAIELIAHGDEQTSQVIGRKVEALNLPSGCRVIALMRDDRMIIAQENTIIKAMDHVVVLVLKQRYLRQVESLFQVSLTFMQ